MIVKFEFIFKNYMPRAISPLQIWLLYLLPVHSEEGGFLPPGPDGRSNLIPGLRGLIVEDFLHFDCRKCSEMHFKLMEKNFCLLRS